MNTLFHTEPLQIADRQFASRLLTGTGKFASAQVMAAAIQASGSELAPWRCAGCVWMGTMSRY